MCVIGPLAQVWTALGPNRLGHRGTDAVLRHASHPGDPQEVRPGVPGRGVLTMRVGRATWWRGERRS
jgi:hypothetical protein